MPATLPVTPPRTSVLDPPVVRTPEPEMAEVRRVAHFIENRPPQERPALVGPGGKQIALPDSVYQVLREAVDLLRRGKSVSIVAADRELTTQQAADQLNVSRPYLIRLLEQGEIPYHKTGTHRRVRQVDLLAYRARRDQLRRSGLRQLVRDAEDQGLYDLPEIPIGDPTPEGN